MDLQRYSRQIILPEIGLEGQQKLFNSSVLIVGVGGLGCPVLQNLSAAGVGKITIIDHDVISLSNLPRQYLFETNDVGRPKVEVASQKIANQNPEIKITPVFEKFSRENALELVKNHDLVIDCSDNFHTRYLINDACVILKKPFVFGSLYKFEGNVAVFNYQNSATYRCLFPTPPSSTEILNCAESGVLGTLTSIIGSFQANEAMKILAGFGKVMVDKLLIINSISNEFSTIPFVKSSNNLQINSLIDYELFCGISNTSKLVDWHELQEWENYDLIDVREEQEYSQNNLGGINIPLSGLENNISMISKNKPVVIQCQAESRSQKAIEILKDKYGFENLFRLRNPPL